MVNLSANPLPTLFGRATVVDAEHANLIASVRRLRDACAILAAAGASTPSADADLGLLVAAFLADLRPHFVAEDSDDYFGTLVAERPSFVPRISHLREEHAEMIRAAERVLALTTGHAHPTQIAAEVGDLLDLFEAHEHAETQLLQEFFSVDDGGGGQ